MTTRLTFLLLIAVLFLVTLASTQNAASTSARVAHPYPIKTLRSSWAIDKNSHWKIHLALQLVKRPELNELQVRIILDAISLANSEFFAASDGTPAKQANADHALQTLERRALAVFPKNEATDLFTNIDGRTDHDILKMYYDVSTLPIKETKVSFRNASANDKSNLWRTHLALFLVKLPELNEQQKKVILDAISLATPEFFEVWSRDPGWKLKVRDPLHSLEEQIVSAFSLNDAAKIFATLRDAESAVCSAFADSVLLKNINYKPLSYSGSNILWTPGRFGWQEIRVEKPDCACSTKSDWCPLSSYCGGTNCTQTQSGCGTLWTYPCDGASCQK